MMISGVLLGGLGKLNFLRANVKMKGFSSNDSFNVDLTYIIVTVDLAYAYSLERYRTIKRLQKCSHAADELIGVWDDK